MLSSPSQIYRRAVTGPKAGEQGEYISLQNFDHSFATNLNDTYVDRFAPPFLRQPLIMDERSKPQGSAWHRQRTGIDAWTPTMLHRWVLALFFVFFLSLIVIMEVVRKVSMDRHGFGPTTSNLHYIWTYAPTAGMKTHRAFVISLFIEY